MTLDSLKYSMVRSVFAKIAQEYHPDIDAYIGYYIGILYSNDKSKSLYRNNNYSDMSFLVSFKI